MALLSGAARTPIKGKAAKPHFKSNGADLAPLGLPQKLKIRLILSAGKEVGSNWEALGLDINKHCLLSDAVLVKSYEIAVCHYTGPLFLSL
jgi:hypothetical protein